MMMVIAQGGGSVTRKRAKCCHPIYQFQMLQQQGKAATCNSEMTIAAHEEATPAGSQKRWGVE